MCQCKCANPDDDIVVCTIHFVSWSSNYIIESMALQKKQSSSSSMMVGINSDMISEEEDMGRKKRKRYMETG